MKPKREAASTDVSSITKSLEGLTVEDQVSKLVKRVAESEELNRKLKDKSILADKLQKANVQLEKKLEKANHVLLRTEEAKGKLEELCRELQKLNKQVREESMGKIRILENERHSTVEHLKTTLQDIEKSMTQGRERSDSLAEDNKRLAGKLVHLGEEYQERLSSIEEQYQNKEKYWNELINAKDIEIKLHKAKLDAANCNIEKLELEKQGLMQSLLEGTARVGGAIESEKKLRAEVKQYAERYQDLTKSISASSDTFDKFRKEIDRVNSNLKKMENDAMKWKQKYEEASKNVLCLTMAKKELEDNAAVSAKKLTQLEQLCRALSGRQAQSATDQTVSETNDESTS